MSQQAICLVVVGGGIAATSCIEALFHEFHNNSASYHPQIVLVAPSKIVKKATNYELIGRHIEKFDVIEEEHHEGIKAPDGIKFRFVEAIVERINFNDKKIMFRSDQKVSHLVYDALCLCLGASPRLPKAIEESQELEVGERIVLIRDNNSIKELEGKLSLCKKVLLVGNGGIGLELVDKITNCEKVWLIRDDSIGLNFLDVGAAKFLLDSSKTPNLTVKGHETSTFIPSMQGDKLNAQGPSLGPHWLQDCKLKGNQSDTDRNDVEIINNDEVKLIQKSQDDNIHHLNIITFNGLSINCDLVVFGTGVVPNTKIVRETKLELDKEDGNGIIIDDQMRTSISQVYAAGDVVSCKNWPKNDLWFQMRLWTQARSMGFYAGRCIIAHIFQQNPSIYFNFDCFTHCTSFFNHRVILLGRYNREHLAHEVLVRANPGKDYVKVLMNKDGKIFGAVLVGESGLEETIENLIHDAIDISYLKDKLLDDTVDIDDYFD